MINDFLTPLLHIQSSQRPLKTGFCSLMHGSNPTCTSPTLFEKKSSIITSEPPFKAPSKHAHAMPTKLDFSLRPVRVDIMKNLNKYRHHMENDVEIPDIFHDHSLESEEHPCEKCCAAASLYSDTTSGFYMTPSPQASFRDNIYTGFYMHKF